MRIEDIKAHLEYFIDEERKGIREYNSFISKIKPYIDKKVLIDLMSIVNDEFAHVRTLQKYMDRLKI